MTDEHSDNEWRHLAEASRKAGAGRGAVPSEAPPDGFVARMREIRGGLWAVAKLLFWRRWSLVAVVLAVIVLVVVFLVTRSSPAPVLVPPEPPQMPSP